MILDKFIEITDEIIILLSGCPCSDLLKPQDNIKRVDEILKELRQIDMVALCAEMLDANSKEQTLYKLKVMEKKIGEKKPFISLPDDWHIALSNPFTNEAVEEIRDIMKEHTRDYIQRWNWVFNLWGGMSKDILNTIEQMKELAEISTTGESTAEQKYRYSKEQIESVFDEMERNRYIKRDGESYEWLKGKKLLDFFLGVLLCGDEAYKDNYDKSHWEIMGDMPMDAVSKLFPKTKNIGQQRRNAKSRQIVEDIKPPKGWEAINNMIQKGY